ncbi:hypothetical protein [Sedimenticola selenatireducens]|nr:hypothetical protein [Sedimenticola selenatireducens]
MNKTNLLLFASFPTLLTMHPLAWGLVITLMFIASVKFIYYLLS